MNRRLIISMNRIKTVAYSFYAFLLIFQPPLFNIRMSHIVGGIAWIYILLHWRTCISIFMIPKVRMLLRNLSLIFLYVVLVILFNGNDISQSFYFLLWLIEIIPSAVVLVVANDRRRGAGFGIIPLILYAGSIFAVLAIVAFINPNIQMLFVKKISTTLSPTATEVYQRIALSGQRLFGLSTMLASWSSYIQAVITLMAVFYAANKKFSHIVLVPCLVFASVVNSRTSAIVLLVSFVIFIICSGKQDVKSKIKKILIVAVALTSMPIVMKVIKLNFTNIYNALESGMDQIVNFIFSGDTTGDYFSVLRNSSYLLLPNCAGIVFGLGSRAMGGNTYGARSDIGFINDIWLGGIVYSIAIWFLFIYMFTVLYKNPSKDIVERKCIHYIAACLFALSPILNFKGYIFSFNDVTTVIFILFIYVVYNDYKGGFHNYEQ